MSHKETCRLAKWRIHNANLLQNNKQEKTRKEERKFVISGKSKLMFLHTNSAENVSFQQPEKAASISTGGSVGSTEKDQEKFK